MSEKAWDGKYHETLQEKEFILQLTEWKREVLQIKLNSVPDDRSGTSILCKLGIHNYMNVPFKSMESWNLRRDSGGYVASYYVCCRKNCHKVATERHTINERYF